MSHNRFTDILRFIRFDNITREDRKSCDKIARIRSVTDAFGRNFRESFNSSNEGTIDEELMTFHGRRLFQSLYF